MPGEYIDIPSLFDRDKKRKLVMSYILTEKIVHKQ